MSHEFINPNPSQTACLHAQLCPAVCNPLVCSPPGSSVYGVFQARILESVAISCSRGASLLRDQTPVSLVPCIGRQILYNWRHLGSPKSNKVSVEKANFQSKKLFSSFC